MKDAVHEPADRIRAEDQPAKHPHGQSDLIASLAMLDPILGGIDR